MRIVVDKPVSLADSKINILIHEAPAHQKITICASMSLPWAVSVTFKSTAIFETDRNGFLDLSTQAPISGDYQGINSMGLIESLQAVSGKVEEVGRNISVDQSILITLVAKCDMVESRIIIERRFMSDEVTANKITTPFVGMFYQNQKATHKTIIMLGGSDGALGNNLPIASLLASHGYHVLTVAYFSEEGLPKDLVSIPIEYFESVFDWLNHHSVTKGTDIYLHGTSKGGELGLLLASRFSMIKKVAAFAPHAYCFQGISFKTRAASWTYQGQSLPYIRLSYRTMFRDLLRSIVKNIPFGYANTYRQGITRAKNRESARIRVENAKSDLLLFAGEKDNIWNAYDGCLEIMAKLSKEKYQYDYQLVAYNHVGHTFYVPYVIPIAVFSGIKIAPRLLFTTGGDVKANLEAQIDSWQLMLDFFKK